jgi:phytoene synthase
MPPSSRGLSFANEQPAFAAARNVCRRQMRGYYFAGAFLPKEKRDGVCAAIAFCAMVAHALSDVPAMRSPGIQIPGRPPSGDGSGDSLDSRLALLRDRLDEIYSDRLDLPQPQFRSQEQHILRAISLTVTQYQIPQQYFLDFAIGQQMSATIVRFPTWSSLEKFCYHTSGVVALILGCILGLTHSDVKRQMIQLGSAIGFTNILRDVKRDCSRGRIYLPLEDLARFKYSDRDLAAGIVNDQFKELMKFEIDRARNLYREGADAITWLGGDGSRFAASLIALNQAAILETIEQRDYDIFNQTADASFVRKLTNLPRAWKLARRASEEPLPNLFG